MATSKKSYPWKQTLSSNSTDTDFTAKVPTTTEPTGTGVIDLDGSYRHANEVPETLIVMPYGSDANNETFNMRVWAWVPDEESATIWIPQLLSELAVTLGNISYGDKGTNHFLADTLVETVDVAGVTIYVTTDLAAAYAEIPIKGAFKLEFNFDRVTAATANSLYRFV